MFIELDANRNVETACNNGPVQRTHRTLASNVCPKCCNDR